MKKNVFIETIIIPYFIPILLTLFLSVIVLLFINRFTITMRNIQNKKDKRKINAFLPKVIFGEFSEVGLNLEIEKLKDEVSYNSYWFKELLISSLIEFKINLKGIENNSFHTIYEAFALNEHSCRFLKFSMIYFIKKGIYQLEILDYKPVINHIRKYIYHDNQKLSANALMAYIILSEKDFSYLVNLDYEFAFAEEIEILGICKRRKLKRPKLLKHFLLSENDFIVRVGLHLAVYYNASDLESEITDCIYHENTLVRKLAYIALSYLFLFEKADEIIMRYTEETEANQTLIIVTLSKIGNNKHQDFLKSLLLENSGNELEIGRAVKSIDPAFMSYLAFNNQNIKNIKKHIDEPLLK